jgi:hypothetical protein
MFDFTMLNEAADGIYGRKDKDRFDPEAYESWKNFFFIWASITVSI